MKLIRNEDREGYIFSFSIKNGEEHVGDIIVVPHPKDPKGGQVHLEIVEKWRCRWLTKRLAGYIYYAVTDTARDVYQLNTLYSTLIHKNSLRLLEFFGFEEYYKTIPNKYYYMNLRGGSLWEYQH
jgi:hypothetical protein